MLDMIVQTLPIPNPDDWVTVAGAAKILGKSTRQIKRYLEEQRIAGYRLYGARDTLAERMIWRPELLAFKEAVDTFRRPGVAEQVKRRAAAAAHRP